MIPISIRGDVNQKDLDLFSNLAEPVVDSGYTRIVFDLNEVDWFPDPCFGIFTRFLKPAKEHNGEVVFCGVKPEMERQMATSHHHSDCEEMSRC